jgi:hypothetical protein
VKTGEGLRAWMPSAVAQLLPISSARTAAIADVGE